MTAFSDNARNKAPVRSGEVEKNDRIGQGEGNVGAVVDGEFRDIRLTEGPLDGDPGLRPSRDFNPTCTIPPGDHWLARPLEGEFFGGDSMELAIPLLASFSVEPGGQPGGMVRSSPHAQEPLAVRRKRQHVGIEIPLVDPLF